MDFAEFDNEDSKNKLSSVFAYIGALRKKNQVLLKSALGNTGVQSEAHEDEADDESIDDGYSDRSEMDEVNGDVGNDDYFDSGSGGGPGDNGDEEGDGEFE